MGRLRGRTGPLALLVVLAATGCSAPLAPESKRADAAGSGRPSASASARPDAAPSDETPSTPAPTRTPSATRPVKPTITVPENLTRPKKHGVVLGADVSWPQCPKGMGIAKKRSQGSPMPLDSARYVIIGLTNGPAFYPNPCLASQVAWARDRHLLTAAYSVISYPEKRHLAAYGDKGPYDGSTRLGALSNVGYQQARFNLASMKRAGLPSPVVWLDVEPVPEFDWPTDTTANAAVVRGAARGYTDAGFRIGAYSTQALWRRVVGDLALGIPEWRPAGQTSRREALRRCGTSRMFQGGDSVLAQWVGAGRDQNVTCPGTSAQMLTWFHQF